MVDHENPAADLPETEDSAAGALPQLPQPLQDTAPQLLDQPAEPPLAEAVAAESAAKTPTLAPDEPRMADSTAEEHDGHAHEAAHLEAAMPHSEESEAQVEERPVAERAALVAAGEQWGLVDEEANVRVKERDGSPGRVVGKMKGQNPASALGFFALKFQQITEKVDALEREMEGEAVKTRFLGRLNSMLQWIPRASALGDFDALVARVEALRADAQAQSESNRQRKEDLCRRAEELSESSEWKNTAEAVKALQAEWKTVGPVVPRDDDQALWTRFRAAGNRFFERRNEHFDRVEKEQKENRRRKEDLCQRAEALLADTSNFKTTAEAFKALQAEWKSIGPVLPRERNTALWERFRKANDQFFDRRQSHLEQLGRDQEENLRRKLELCEQAEALRDSEDWRAAADGFKALQAEWKTIGPAPKEHHESIWERFRAAADAFFERRKEHFGQTEKEQKENLRRKQALADQAERLSTSLDFKATTEALKALQAEWRTIGPVPRDKADALWERFRGANDRFFARRSAYFEQRDQERSEPRSGEGSGGSGTP